MYIFYAIQTEVRQLPADAPNHSNCDIAPLVFEEPPIAAKTPLWQRAFIETLQYLEAKRACNATRRAPSAARAGVGLCDVLRAHLQGRRNLRDYRLATDFLICAFFESRPGLTGLP
jgi:hypothetical protein